VQQQLVPKLGW